MVTSNTLTSAEAKSIVEFIAGETPYFIDNSVLTVDNATVKHFNVALSLWASLDNLNVMYVGSPGTGKSTLANLMCAVHSGLPFDLYNGLKIQGHPDHTKDSLLMRPDIGKLVSAGEEQVIIQATLLLPCYNLDEINRLTPGKQAIVLEYLRTQVAEHLGTVFSRGKIPVFCTMNYNGPGTFALTQPSLDRFDISIEVPKGAGCVRSDIRDARERLNASRLCDEKESLLIRKKLGDKRITPEEKIEFLTERAEKRESLLPVTPARIKSFEMPNIPFNPQAVVLQNCIWEELNTTPLYGENRACDPRDYSDHNQSKRSTATSRLYFANSYVEGGVSQRFDDSLHFFSTMLAWYLGHKEVTVNHIQAVAPYCLSHRAQFAESFKASFTEQPRVSGERVEQDLARRVFEGIKDNYDDVNQQLSLADSYLSKTLPEKRLGEVEAFAKGPVPDHPLLCEYWKEVKKHFK